MVEQIPLIVWNDRKAMGVLRLDEDHHGIVDLFNQLIQASALNDAALIEHGLDELAESTDAHFSREENYIQSVKSSLLSRHLHQHEALLRELEHIRTEYFMGDLEGRLPSVLQTLGSDLSFHLFRDDLDITRALGLTPVEMRAG